MPAITSAIAFVGNHRGDGDSPDDPGLFSIDEIMAYAVPSNIASAATSTVTSQVASGGLGSIPISTADSKAVSSGTRASVADSKAISQSVNTSVADSKAVSVSSNTSIADSKATSVAAAVIVPSVGGTPGFLQRGSTAVVRTANGKMGERLSVTDFGAVGDDSTDNATAIQNAIDTQTDLTYERSQALGDVGINAGSVIDLYFPPGTYRISRALTLGPYSRIVGGSEVFLKQTNSTQNILDSDASLGGSGHYTLIKGIHFIGGKRHIRLVRPGSDVSMALIEDCTHSSGSLTEFAIELECQSGMVLIRRARVIDAPLWLKATDCDQLHITDSWIDGYSQTTGKKPTNTASIELRSSAGTNNRTYITNCLFVPEPEVTPTAALTRWIDLYDYVALKIDRCQFGGENAGFPIVYNYASAAVPSGAYPQGGGISIRRSQVSSGYYPRADRGVVVLRDAIPNQIIVEECDQLANGFVINDMIAGGAAAWIAAHLDSDHPKLNIELRNIMGNGITLIGNDVAGVQTAITDLDDYAITHECTSITVSNAPDPFTAPALKARKHLFVPAKTHTLVQAEALNGAGLVFVDTSNKWLAVNPSAVAADQFFLAGPATPNANGLAVPVAKIRGPVTVTDTLDWTDQTVLVNTTGGAVSINLPAASVCTIGQSFHVKISAGTNNCVVAGQGGATIDGAANKTWNTALVGYTFTMDSSGNWWITAKAVA